LDACVPAVGNIDEIDRLVLSFGITVTYWEERQAAGANRLFSIFATRVSRSLRVNVHCKGEAVRFGRAAAYMCSPQANYHEPRQAIVVQLEEARTEWRRRITTVFR
jgi:hypothetical protein